MKETRRLWITLKLNSSELNTVIFDYRLSPPELSFYVDFDFFQLDAGYQFKTPLLFRVNKEDSSHICRYLTDAVSPDVIYWDRFENEFLLFEDLQVSEKSDAELELKKIK
ncbi:MAG: hypothetical protein ACOC44_20090 [Promethearchaeia archaeon]